MLPSCHSTNHMSGEGRAVPQVVSLQIASQPVQQWESLDASSTATLAVQKKQENPDTPISTKATASLTWSSALNVPCVKGIPTCSAVNLSSLSVPGHTARNHPQSVQKPALGSFQMHNC